MVALHVKEQSGKDPVVCEGIVISYHTSANQLMTQHNS